MPTTVSLVTSVLAELVTYVQPDDLTTYDALEVWRSTLGEGGFYAELSAPEAEPALLPLTHGDSVGAGAGALANLSGKSVTLLYNGITPITFTFSGSDPLTLRQAVNQVNAASNPRVVAYLDDANRFVFSTVASGGNITLVVTGGDAAPGLGLTTGDLSTGQDARPELTSGELSYRFRDYFGQKGYSYKTRLRTTGGSFSAFSPPFYPGDLASIDPVNLVRGYVKLIQSNGKVLPGARVEVYNNFLSQRVGDRTVVQGTSSLLTDAQGYAELLLVRGITVEVSVSGTTMIHRVTTPTDTAVQLFDLLDPVYSDNDAYAVQHVVVPDAERGDI